MRNDGDDWMSAGTAAAHLGKLYSGWTVTTAHGCNGVLRFVAIRDGFAPGLSVVIGSYSEVRAALAAERRGRLRAAS